MMKSNIHMIEPIAYNNNKKIFDIKFNPVNNDIALVDMIGKLKIFSLNENKLVIKNNFHPIKESIQTLDYNNTGERILLGTSGGDLLMTINNKITLKKNKIASIKYFKG